jgi:8-oxo-dGTP pyrophosphatase MutT (NUDIX family)
MYKVFVNGKLIKLIADFSQYKSEDHALFLRFYSKEALGYAVELLIKNKGLRELIVYHNDLEALWKNFQSLYQHVPAAGGVVKNKKGHLLFIFKRGTWDLPKGKVDGKESFEKAAIREVQEECGVNDIKKASERGVTYHLYKEGEITFLKETHWFDMDSSFDGDFKVDKKEGIEKAAWVKEKELPKVLSNTYNSIVALLEA